MAVWVGTLNLDCRKCTKEDKVRRGCKKDTPIPGTWELNGEELKRCPLKLIKPQSISYMRAYNFYKKGFLPNPGGWMDQSVKFIQGMELIDREVAKINQQQIDKAREK